MPHSNDWEDIKELIYAFNHAWEEYKDAPFSTQAVYFVSQAMLHEKFAPSGADASYITSRLVDTVTALLLSQKQEVAEKAIEIAKELGHQQEDDSIWLNMDELITALRKSL